MELQKCQSLGLNPAASYINECIKIFDMITEFVLCLLFKVLVPGFGKIYSTTLA